MDERLSEGVAPREPVFVVAGPSGGGKSRLMLELRHRAQMSRAVFVEADCYEGSLSDYEPIVTAVGYLVRLAESVGATDVLDRFAPTLALLDARFDRGRALSVAGLDNPDAARIAMIGQIGEFMCAIAERSPYALYVNDLQWARAGTLDVLLNLSRLIAVRERGGSRVQLALFGSYRDDEVDGRPVEPWLRMLRDHHEIRSVRVEPLTRNEVVSLVGSMLGVDELPDSFVDRITRETAGNPFFISEVMRSLVERGSVYLEQGRWSADRPIGVLEIPVTMATLFERRLEQLDGRERDVLQLIAAYGRPMPLSLVATVAKLDDEGMHHIMLGLLRRQMIARGTVDEQSCAWPIHDRIRELAYAQTDRATRLELHRALAQALEARIERDSNAPLDELARQWWATEDRDKALDYCVRGGQQAKRRHALETGIELLDHALELLPADAPERTNIEKDLAELLALAGDFNRATALYDRLLPKLATTLDRARVLKELGSIAYHRGNTPLALENLWKALALLGESRPRSRAAKMARIATAAATHFMLRFFPFLCRPAKDKPLIAAKADCYLALVYPDFFNDQLELALASLRGTNAAMKVGEGPQLSLAYSYLAFGFYGVALNRFATAAEFGRRALVMADASDLPLHRAHAYEAAMFVHFLTGDWEAGGEAALRAATLFRAHGDMSCVGASYCLLLLHYQARGMLKAARHAAQEGLEIIERVGALSVSTPVSMKHGMLLVDLGHDGLPRVHQAFQMAERMGDPLQRAWVRLLLGHCYFARGEIEQAIGYLESCVDIRRRFHLDADFLSPRAHPLLARAYIDAARQTTESGTKKDLVRRANRQAVAAMRSMRRRSTYRAAALLAMAECRWEEGDEQQARTLFDQSIAFAEGQGARMMLADAHYELGRRLRDAGEAREHLQIALDLYDACDAVPYVQFARRAMAAIAPTRP
jgi:tetratricopeptide (TPR) repeat protein